jgi:hypothetical protein
MEKIETLTNLSHKHHSSMALLTLTTRHLCREKNKANHQARTGLKAAKMTWIACWQFDFDGISLPEKRTI